MAVLRPRFRTPEDKAAGRVSGYTAVFFDPTRRPARKSVSLHTRDATVARHRLAALEKREAVEGWDPWADTAPEAGVSVAEAARRYTLAQAAAGRSPHTVATGERLLGLFAGTLPVGCLVAHVERRHVVAFLAGRKPNGTKRSPATVTRYRTVVAHFLGWAVREGLAKANAAAGVEAPKAHPNRRDHVTEAEERAMLRAMDAAEVLDGRSRAWLRHWLAFATRTGLRPGEQRDLRWSAVRLAEGTVQIGKDGRVKTAGSVRTVPVVGEALAVLHRLHAERTGEADGPVFRGSRGGPVEMRHLSKALAGFATAAGVEKRVTAYSTRHAAGTRLVLAGVPVFVVAKALGTSVQMVEAHYAHACPEAGAAAFLRAFGEAPAATPVEVPPAARSTAGRSAAGDRAAAAVAGAVVAGAEPVGV